MSFPKYSEYKDSGIEWLGEVPAHWDVKRLRYVADLNPSKSEVRSWPDESSVSFIPMESVGDDGSLSLDQVRPISEVLAGYTYVREGDVAIAKITPCFENGKGAVMRGLKNNVGFGTTELTVMRPKAGLTTSNYLYRVVSSEPFRVLGESSMYGAGGQKRVPDDFVRNFAIAWPPYKEQVEIQAFLNHETARIDALIEEQQRLIELLKEKRQAVISHAVTKGLDPDVPMKDSGVEWLGEVPAHWEIKQLKHIVNPATSITYGIVQAGPDYEGGVPYIKTSDMSGDELPLHGYSKTSPDIDRSYRRSKVSCGDVVVAIRATVGKCLKVPEGLGGANLTQGTAKVSPGEKVLPDFLLFSMRSNPTQAYFDEMAKGATFKEITLDSLRRTPIALPPVAEQEAIVARVAHLIPNIDRLLFDANKSVLLLQERRSALISAAVTGKIDVRDWQAEQQVGSSELLMAAEERAIYG